MQPDFNWRVIAGMVIRILDLITSAVVMGITANKLRLELIKGKEFCYYGFALENPSGTLEACNLAIAAGAVTMAFCVIFSTIAAISALRGSGADTKSAHLAEFILMTILELLWIATLVFLVYLLVAKTDLDLDNSTRSLSEGTTNALIVVVFCALSAGFTGASAELHRSAYTREDTA